MDASAATISATTTAVLSKLMHLSNDSCPHAYVLSRALEEVSQWYSVTVPTAKAASTIVNSLDMVLERLQQHRVFDAIDDVTYTPEQQIIIENGLRLLWAHTTTYQLHVALIDIVKTIDFMPRAITFWKIMHKRKIRAKIQSGPFEWFTPSSQRITISERIRSLEETLEAHLKKIGVLKNLTSKGMGKFTTYEDLEGLMTESLKLLEVTYSSKGISTPRKGRGIFMHAEPIPNSTLYLDTNILMDTQDGVIRGKDVVGSLHRLEQNLNAFRFAREQFAVCFQTAIAPCVPPSKLRQRWLHVTIAALCLTTGGYWVINNQEEFKAAIGTFRSSLADFLHEHMVEPIQAIVGEVILNQKQDIQDVLALQDTKDSLRRMLSDFMKDTNPTLPRPEVERILKNMDMSVVSLQYEKQLGSAVRNIMTGDIVRMLLIQVQFIKKELMVAMGAIDELMHANQLNLQIMATIPTFIVFGGLYKLTHELFHQIYKRMSERLYYGPAEIATFLRNNLRDIERLLNKQNRSGNGLKDDKLGVCDLGKLILLLHQLRNVFESYRGMFLEEEQERFEEDLNDLIEEGLLVSQQLAVIQRMYHSHPFLHRVKVTSKWLG